MLSQYVLSAANTDSIRQAAVLVHLGSFEQADATVQVNIVYTSLLYYPIFNMTSWLDLLAGAHSVEHLVHESLPARQKISDMFDQPDA